MDVAKMVEVLNELCDAAPEAMNSLVNHRVPSTEKLADHPTCQVGREPDYEVGMIGVLNAIAGTHPDGHGFICAIYNDDGEFQQFGMTDGKGGIFA